MKHFAPVLIAAVSLAACSQSERYPAGPSSLTSSATHSTADDTPTGDPKNSFPHDAPKGWTFTWQGNAHDDGAKSFFAAWTPVVNITKYETAFETYATDNAWKPLPSIYTNAPTKFQGVLPKGIRVRARTRSIGAGDQGIWTAYLELTNGWPEVTEIPNTPAEECWWEETGLQFFRLVFGRR